MTPGIGHNQGPTLERGQKWRAFQWRKARDDAMPKTMPLMVVRMHVARAHALGLDYPTYAAVRQASGRDIMGLLFSSNALRILRAEAPRMPLSQGQKLAAVQGARKLALIHLPLSATVAGAANPELDAVGAAPQFTDTWSEMANHLHRVIADQRLARDQVLIVGDTMIERDWTAAARAAGYVEAERYFS